MEPPFEDACPGPCNRRYRDAWTTYNKAHAAWRAQCTVLSTRAAQLLADAPADEDLDPGIYDALYAIELPPHPDTPDGPPRKLPEPPEQPGDTGCRGGDPVWCRRCQSLIRAALIEIGDLAAALESWSDGHRGAASGEHVSTRRTSAPSPSPIGDELDKLYGMIAEVEQQWRQHAGHPARPSRARGGDARQRTLNYLLEQSAHILANPGSVRFGRGVLGWVARLQDMTKTDPVVRRRPGRCPRCTWVNVLHSREDSLTECRNCGRLMNEDEYQEDVVGAADTAVVDDTRAARAAS